jgi:TatD DNase family protein
MEKQLQDYTLLDGLSDTHAHFSYLAERGINAEENLNYLANAGFKFLLDIGTHPDDLPKRISAYSAFNGQNKLKLRFSTGLWPSQDAIKNRSIYIEELEKNYLGVNSELVCAIGECGFDRPENPDWTSAEQELFEAQFEIAKKYKLPVIIHSRDDFEHTLEVVNKYRDVTSIIHCFSYTEMQAKKYLDCGAYVSFAGNLTYKNAQTLRDAINVIPDDKLLLETDCPYLAPVPHRGKPCDSSLIIETYKVAAASRNTDLESIKTLVYNNATKIFIC